MWLTGEFDARVSVGEAWVGGAWVDECCPPVSVGVFGGDDALSVRAALFPVFDPSECVGAGLFSVGWFVELLSECDVLATLLPVEESW